MKRSDLKELIKKSMLEVSPNSGAMTPEEEKMVADYEEEEANKYALDKEEPMEEALLAEDNLEVKSIAKKLYSWLKQNGIATKLIAQTPSADYGKQIGASLKGGSNEALISYYDDPKTKQTVIQVQLYGGPTSKDLVLQVEKKLLSGYPGLEQYDRQEIPAPQFFNLNFKVKEKTTAKGGLAGNTRSKQEPMEEDVLREADEIVAAYAEKKTIKEEGILGATTVGGGETDTVKTDATSQALLGAIAKMSDSYLALANHINKAYPQAFSDPKVSMYMNGIAQEIKTLKQLKQGLKEEMHGGYLELLEMNPAFDEGVASLLQAWNDWKEGDMTEPYMVEEAKQDVLAYLSSMMS